MTSPVYTQILTASLSSDDTYEMGNFSYSPQSPVNLLFQVTGFGCESGNPNDAGQVSFEVLASFTGQAGSFGQLSPRAVLNVLGDGMFGITVDGHAPYYQVRASAAGVAGRAPTVAQVSAWTR